MNVYIPLEIQISCLWFHYQQGLCKRQRLVPLPNQKRVQIEISRSFTIPISDNHPCFFDFLRKYLSFTMISYTCRSFLRLYFRTNLFLKLKNRTNFFIIFSEIVDYLMKKIFIFFAQIYFSSVFVIRILNISTGK